MSHCVMSFLIWLLLALYANKLRGVASYQICTDYHSISCVLNASFDVKNWLLDDFHGVECVAMKASRARKVNWLGKTRNITTQGHQSKIRLIVNERPGHLFTIETFSYRYHNTVKKHCQETESVSMDEIRKLYSRIGLTEIRAISSYIP